MEDFGTTYSDFGEAVPSCGCGDCNKANVAKEPKKHYPRQTFNSEQVPEIASAQVGDTVRMVVECEVVAVERGRYEYSDEKNVKTEVTLKMIRGSAKVIKTPDEKDIEDMMNTKKDSMDKLMEDSPSSEDTSSEDQADK